MRFLADQDVWQVTVAFLRELGHDVITAHELGEAAASDRELLRLSCAAKRILVTRDKDYGSLVFLESVERAGVIFLRIAPSNQGEVHSELKRVLAERSQTELEQVFCGVEPGRYRVRRPSC